MGAFLYFRQKLSGIFIRNEAFLMPLVKFLVMMVTILMLNWHLGYRYILMRWIVVILVSLISALLPWSGMAALAAVYLLGHVSALSLEGTAMLLVVLLGAAMLHYLFLPGASILVMLTPLAFYLKVPYLIPILAGLFGSATVFIPVGEGVLIYYLMMSLERNAPMFLAPGGSMLTNFMQVFRSLQDPQLYLTLIAFCAAALAVCGITRLHMDYAYMIAAIAGGVLVLLVLLLGSYVLSLNLAAAGVVGGCILCTLIAVIVCAWYRSLDYSSVEYLEYEDDDYIYYVKAVPKLKIAETERRVYEIADDEEVDMEEDSEY